MKVPHRILMARMGAVKETFFSLCTLYHYFKFMYSLPFSLLVSSFVSLGLEVLEPGKDSACFSVRTFNELGTTVAFITDTSYVIM